MSDADVVDTIEQCVEDGKAHDMSLGPGRDRTHQARSRFGEGRVELPPAPSGGGLEAEPSGLPSELDGGG